ncbi:MAG: Oligopeptide transport ATP-binding protein OppF, partial [uncultured Acetobacteraceae bacterium]
ERRGAGRGGGGCRAGPAHARHGAARRVPPLLPRPRPRGQGRAAARRARAGGDRPRGGRRGPLHLQGRSGGAGRRERLRQVHPRPHGGRHPAAERRDDPVARARPAEPQRHGRARGEAAHADDLPGPLRLAQPAPQGGGDRGRGAAVPRHGRAPRPRNLRGRADAPRGARPRLPPPLPAPVLRRPAAAHRHRAGAGGA